MDFTASSRYASETSIRRAMRSDSEHIRIPCCHQQHMLACSILAWTQKLGRATHLPFVPALLSWSPTCVFDWLTNECSRQGHLYPHRLPYTVRMWILGHFSMFLILARGALVFNILFLSLPLQSAQTFCVCGIHKLRRSARCQGGRGQVRHPWRWKKTKIKSVSTPVGHTNRMVHAKKSC